MKESKFYYYAKHKLTKLIAILLEFSHQKIVATICFTYVCITLIWEIDYKIKEKCPFIVEKKYKLTEVLIPR